MSQIGKKRHYLHFVLAVLAEDSVYAPYVSYPESSGVPPVETGFRAWGEVIYLSGRELWLARQVNAEVQGKIRIRFRETLDGTWRIKYRGRWLEILSVLAGGDLRETEILFREWVDRDD